MRTGWGGQKSLEKAYTETQQRPKEKFFNIFSKKNLHVLKKVPTFASLLRNNPTAKSHKAHIP